MNKIMTKGIKTLIWIVGVVFIVWMLLSFLLVATGTHTATENRGFCEGMCFILETEASYNTLRHECTCTDINNRSKTININELKYGY